MTDALFAAIGDLAVGLVVALIIFALILAPLVYMERRYGGQDDAEPEPEPEVVEAFSEFPPPWHGRRAEVNATEHDRRAA